MLQWWVELNLGADIFLWLNYVEADENCTSLGYYAVSSGDSLPTFLGQPIFPIFKALEVGIITTPCIITHKCIVLIHFTAEAWNHTYVEAPLELLCLLHVNQHINDFGSFISSSVGDSTWHCTRWYFSHHIVPPVRIIFLRHLKYIAGFKGVAGMRRVLRPPWAAESQGQQNEYCKWKMFIFGPKRKVLNYKAKWREIQLVIVKFLKFVISLHMV